MDWSGVRSVSVRESIEETKRTMSAKRDGGKEVLDSGRRTARVRASS
jgi:hypothetical protein